MQEPFAVKGIRFGEGRPVICVPVVEREREAIVRQIRKLIENKVQMIEWRADCFDAVDSPDEVRALLGDIRPMVEDTVMLFTLRTKHQGGRADLSEKEILYLDEIAAKSGSIDLVDLEYFEVGRPEREIRRLRQMGVRVVSSHHDFSKTPEDVVLHKVMEEMQRGGGDIVKLAVMPNSTDDLIRLLALTNDTRQKYPGLPIVTIAMGDLGVVSRITGEAFGSCISFGADGAGSAPGQLKADTLAVILDALHESMSAGKTEDAAADPAYAGPDGPLFLIGFMGVGKSAVSGKLHDVLGMRQIDLDEEIERESGISVAEMFDRFGEEYFREKETAMLRQIADGGPAVISCGGGCVLREENVSILKESGTTVLLTAEPETIFERVRDSAARPILNGHMDVAYIAGLMEQRREAYEAACDLCIATDARTPEEIADEIAAAVRTGPKSDDSGA